MVTTPAIATLITVVTRKTSSPAVDAASKPLAAVAEGSLGSPTCPKLSFHATNAITTNAVAITTNALVELGQFRLGHSTKHSLDAGIAGYIQSDQYRRHGATDRH